MVLNFCFWISDAIERNAVRAGRECPHPESRYGHPANRMLLAGEEVFDLLDEDVAAHVADGFGEGELFGAGLDAVLREAALLDAAVSGQCAEAFFFEDGAARVHVEELGLSDGG